MEGQVPYTLAAEVYKFPWTPRMDVLTPGGASHLYHGCGGIRAPPHIQVKGVCLLTGGASLCYRGYRCI